MTPEIIFWTLLGIILYNYIIYPFLLAFIALVKIILKKPEHIKDIDCPEVTLLIPAYNEIDYIDRKIENTNNLNYPKEKLQIIWVTDGSDDGTYEKLKNIKEVTVFHENERNGKIGAVNRIMKNIDTPFVIFCDANTMLNKDCIREILKPFSDKKVGCVAGEKRIIQKSNKKAVSSGEGMYWKYESIIKMLESYVNSTVGAAGELFAIRTGLFEEIPGDSIVEDFVLSLSVIKKKYKTKYTRKAKAEESSSLNIKEELKRKVRIAYGSIQTLFRYPGVLNPFKTGFFSFQYFSHKVLRWTIVPLSIPFIFLLNILLYIYYPAEIIYAILLIFQIAMYILAICGMVLQNKNIKIPFFFVPFYFLVMNLSIYKGYIRYIFSKQSINWDKAKRL